MPSLPKWSNTRTSLAFIFFPVNTQLSRKACEGQRVFLRMKTWEGQWSKGRAGQ